MGTTRLDVYNTALMYLKTSPIASLSDNRPERISMDAAWNSTVAYCLEQGMWNFATKTQEISSSDTEDPTFGYAFAFEKPNDYVRITAISAFETLRPTLFDFREEGDYFFADIDPIYLSFVSNATDAGMDVGKWFPSFADYVALNLATNIPNVSTMSEDAYERLDKRAMRAMANAKSKDSVNQPTAWMPSGRLVQARRGSAWRDRDWRR